VKANKIKGAIFGAAYGDALARPTEFMRVPEIESRYGDLGPGRVGMVTDDTQMMIATGDALVETWGRGRRTPDQLANALRVEYIRWSKQPDLAKRAPGGTCLRSIERLRSPMAWQRATDVTSKGCGANMRVQPIGLLPLSPDDRSGMAQLVGAVTHGHPTALAATDLTAYAVRTFASNIALSSIVDRLIEYGRRQRTVYRATWLGDLADGNPRKWIAYGWDQCLEALWSIRSASREWLPWELDPCVLGGDGWTAETALATALLCATSYSRIPEMVVRRGAVTRGDSDSIACIAGTFAGARYGMGAWPRAWRATVEYGVALENLSNWITSTWRNGR
jgi:ADP-ribosylglycohydrolase